MRIKLKFAILAALMAWFGRDGARAQQQQPVSVPGPDCRIFFSFTAAGDSPVLDNRSVGCDTWEFSYNVFGFTALTLTFQAAPNGSNAASTSPGVPGAWATFGGTIVSGANPAMATDQGATILTGYYPFLRMDLSGLMGSGIVIGELHGTRSAVAGGGGGGGGGCPNPCPVIGAEPVGAPPSDPPVQVGGVGFGGNLEPLLTDNQGAVVYAGIFNTFADGQSNDQAVQNTNFGGPNATVNWTYPYVLNPGVPGAAPATWDRQFKCNQQKMVTLTDGTLTALVAVSGSLTVHACHVHATTSGSSETFSLIQGTGVACAAAPATLDSYVGVQGFATDYSSNAPLTTSASNGLCVQQSGTQTAVVFVTYGQF